MIWFNGFSAINDNAADDASYSWLFVVSPHLRRIYLRFCFVFKLYGFSARHTTARIVLSFNLHPASAYDTKQIQTNLEVLQYNAAITAHIRNVIFIFLGQGVMMRFVSLYSQLFSHCPVIVAALSTQFFDYFIFLGLRFIVWHKNVHKHRDHLNYNTRRMGSI